jgi:methionine synthase II (cobalamin-independent)
LEYAWALAAAMKDEYGTVAKSFCILQIDDPGIWVLWDFWYVDRENLIAGADCGLGRRVHPTIACAKLKALAAGPALASLKLWR